MIERFSGEQAPLLSLACLCRAKKWREIQLGGSAIYGNTNSQYVVYIAEIGTRYIRSYTSRNLEISLLAEKRRPPSILLSV